MKNHIYDKSYEVCSCHHVSLGEIIFSIQKKGATSIKDIKKFTDAGTSCKSCVNSSSDFGEVKKNIYLDDILKKINKD